MTSHAAMLIADQYFKNHIPPSPYEYADPDDIKLYRAIIGRMSKSERRMIKESTRRKPKQVES